MKRLGVVALVLAACGGSHHSSSSPSSSLAGAPSAAAPATNTSLASARALVAGESFDIELPCNGDKLYFGPIKFTADPQKVSLTTVSRSTTGGQVCGGGSWIAEDGSFVGVAGLGCPELTTEANLPLDFEHTPGNGGPGQNPIYLELHREGDAAAPGCATVSSRITVKELP